jgi:hypothetical protein
LSVELATRGEVFDDKDGSLALRAPVAKWSLTSLQRRLVKTGGLLIQHARYYWLLLAEGHFTRRLCGGMLWKIAALPLISEANGRSDCPEMPRAP